MSRSYPPFAVFPDLNCIVRLPSGGVYRGKLRQHPSTKEPGEHWYEGWVRAEGKDEMLAGTNLRDAFARSGQHPAYFHPDSNVEPLRIKLNRIPKDQRSEKNFDTLLAELWAPDGLWSIVASPSKSEALLIAGSVVPSKHELAHPASRIKHFQPEPVAEEKPAAPVKQGREATTAPKAARGKATAARPA